LECVSRKRGESLAVGQYLSKFSDLLCKHWKRCFFAMGGENVDCTFHETEDVLATGGEFEEKQRERQGVLVTFKMLHTWY
jgi:hypothetical protein